jgi:serine protease Do
MSTRPTSRPRSCRAASSLLPLAVLALGGCSFGRLWEPSREQVLERILPSAVQVVLEQQEGRRFRSSSGIAIGARGSGHETECFVVTAGHTVSGPGAATKAIYVVFDRHRGGGTKVPASVVAHRDVPHLDVAILRTQSERCAPARPAAAPVLGEPVWVVAFPWGRQMTLGTGIVSQIAIDGDKDTTSRLMVDALVGYGSSGGGVFEARTGRLLGVIEGYNTARVTAQGSGPSWYIDVPMPGQTFVTPVSDIRRFLTEIGHADLFSGDGPRVETEPNAPGAG